MSSAETVTRPPQEFEIAGRRHDWASLLDEALEVPGTLGDTYCRFYEYSFLNCLLLRLQGVNEPVATYKRWQSMGRQVMKGSKAKAIFRPMMKKVELEDGTTASRVIGFRLINCLFGVNETTGDPLPEREPREWDMHRALGALAIQEVPFTELNGNVQGYSFERNVAINPVAAYPFKTLQHELAHIVLGHTAPDQAAEYQTHRGSKEFEAEATAILVVKELDATDQMDEAESRAYVQGWLRGERPDDQSIKRVFSAATAILKAGRLATTNTTEGGEEQ